MQTLPVKALVWLARHGRLLLVAGLIVGIAAPSLGTALRPWLPEMVGGLLFLAALRVERLAVRGSLRASVVFVLVAQVVVPIGFAVAFRISGWSGADASAIVLMSAACTISGAPNLVVLCGHAPDHALRNLVVGALLLPITVIPVLALWPGLGGGWGDLAASAFRLLVLIALAAGAAAIVRAVLDTHRAHVRTAIDAGSGVLMAVLVVALMSAIPVAWSNDPASLALTLCLACGTNFSLQLVGLALWRGAGSAQRVAAAVGLGNRNMALFLAALPAAAMEPLLLFVACYQVPMYLTPVVMRTAYGHPRSLDEAPRDG